MGIGRISFRQLASWTGVLGAILCVGCRTSREGDGLDSQLRVSSAEPAKPSLADGHRFGRWLEVEPVGPARSTLERVCLLEQNGASEEAISLLGEALEETHGCAALLEARGALYLATGFPRAAAGDFQKAVNLRPDHARGWFALGHAYESLGLLRQALEALERAQTLGGQEAGLFLSLARVYHAQDRPGQAARSYRLALQRMDGRTMEVLIEAAVLATEDAQRAASVEKMRERLESCRGVPLTDDGWLLRALVRELPGEPAKKVGSTIRSLEVEPEELTAFAETLLIAVQLVDRETGDETRAELLAAESDPSRRKSLERSLDRP